MRNEITNLQQLASDLDTTAFCLAMLYFGAKRHWIAFGISVGLFIIACAGLAQDLSR